MHAESIWRTLRRLRQILRRRLLLRQILWGLPRTQRSLPLPPPKTYRDPQNAFVLRNRPSRPEQLD